MSFKIGDKVVCVDASSRLGILLRIKKGAVYTIAIISNSGCSCNSLLIGFDEIPQYQNLIQCNKCNREYHGISGLYQSFRFRKLSEVSDELSEEILNEVLTSIPELV